MADLWDHPDSRDRREPKPEPYLSDWLARHLRDDLQGVLVNREVEITPGFTGVKKMREVDLHVAALSPGDDAVGPSRRLAVIVENKGCWNPSVDTDIRDQLVDTYLDQTKGRAGVYVVFCFNCIQSRSKKKTTCRSCARRSAAELRESLEKRASELTTAERLVAAVVIEAGLPESRNRRRREEPRP